MSVGGSHTNFDQGAFGVGAVAGALTLAGALVAGLANHAAACAEHDEFQRLQRERDLAWDAVALSEALRKSDHARACAAELRAAALTAILARRESAGPVAMARAHMQR